MASRKFQDSMPLAPLKIIAMDNCKGISKKVNDYITNRRKQALEEQDSPTLHTMGYDADEYLIPVECSRYGTGEGRAYISQSVRGVDLFIIADVVNYHVTYNLHGEPVAMTPDEHYMDLKRVIMACGGAPRRITVIMPYLYEGRQNVRVNNESLDCAQVLQELTEMGVETIITFDAHDSRVQNAVPNRGFDNFHTSYQFIKEILETNPDLEVDTDHLMVVSPDEGGMRRAVYYASLIGVNMGMFYKRYDYSQEINGKHPMVSIEFLGNDLAGKTVLIMDDMIATGKTMIDAAKEVKARGAKQVIVGATFGIFSGGLSLIDQAVADGFIDKIYTTNLIHCPDELLAREYYYNVDLSAYIGLIIDTLNHDTSVNDILDATERIQELMIARKNKAGLTQ